MYFDPKYRIEVKQEALLDVAEEINDNLYELATYLEDISIKEEEWEIVDKMITKTYLSIDELKSRIFSL